MAKQETKFEVNGVVIDVIPGTKFKVKLENDHECICTISGKLRQNFIKILRGDKVIVEMDVNDLNVGRIVWRDR